MRTHNYCMTNVNFIKEVIPNLEKNNILIILNQKQLKDSIDYFLQNINIVDKKIVLVSFTTSEKELKNKIDQEKIFIIDAFSNERKEEKNFISLKNNNDLVQIQIAIKKALKKLGNNTIIIFDTLNVISLYNSSKEIKKFIYLFSNKTKLEENSCVFFITKDSIEKEIIDFTSQFCDKTFDFSKIFFHTIQTKQN